ncbi:hypothetical protein KCX70_23075 (plasmid) [Stutzerimonas stutzeri]|uniref:hypothetical protein n=1 Tax=Stutzerimonas stutzeri TaxID=316 RepID=UPI001BAE8C50|nr:hypothetical protein [Stutzerimonas stutzeri]QUE78373.1 hypothetical protein KCX70_23075 [Stutzerimonas stutzeri]
MKPATRRAFSLLNKRTVSGRGGHHQVLTLRACSRLFAGGGTGQAGAAVELLQACPLPWMRCWTLGAIEVDQVLLLPIGAGGADLVVEFLQGEVVITRCWSWWVRISATLDVGRRCLGGVVGQGSARKPQRSGTSLLESTERVRTEAKRALAPGA